MNFWHMQIHPSGSDLKQKEIIELLITHKAIGIGERWKNDKGQPEKFKNEMTVDDVVLIRFGGAPLALVKVVSDVKKNKDKPFWFPIYRKIELLALDETGQLKRKFKQATGTNWTKGIYAPTTLASANNWAFFKYWYDSIKQ